VEKKTKKKNAHKKKELLFHRPRRLSDRCNNVSFKKKSSQKISRLKKMDPKHSKEKAAGPKPKEKLSSFFTTFSFHFFDHFEYKS